jgi:outer membrane protein TolC
VTPRSISLAGTLVALVATGASAQAVADTLTAEAAVRIALEANPMLQAARASAAAAAQRVGPAGSLPDPRLQLGLMNRMQSAFGATDDPMTMDQVQLMQMVPWPGRLSAARRAARHGAAAVAADAAEQARMLGASVLMAYYEVAYADRARDVMERTRALLRDFLNVATTMYAVGSAGQQDVLRAQVEVARMGEEIVRMGQMRLAAATRLNALLGRDVATPVGPVRLPDFAADALAPGDTLFAWALAARPALRAGAERVTASEAALTAARRELLPDFEVGVAFQRRPAFPDMVSLMVGVNLPLFAAARQLPMRREMAAMRDMAAAELANLRNETAARIIELRARATQDYSLGRLYRGSVLPQARAAVQAGLSGYRVGRVTFMQLLDDQMTVNRYDIETYRLLADYHLALGELEALVGRRP